MELTRKQAEGLKIAINRFRDHEKYTVISGYAGSGKSTLIKYIVNGLLNEGVEPEEICYATFTGKAAQVLIQKGLTNVFTLHKLLFNCTIDNEGVYHFFPKEDVRYGIIIVDECSMMPASFFGLLMNQPAYIIFCGDPGQLPVVDKDDANHLLDKPHIFLDEIMRQAQDSGIIRLSMLIREGKSLAGFSSNEAKIFPQTALSTGMLNWGDMVLAATNKTRHEINDLIRQSNGMPKNITNGDKIICLHNYWDIGSLVEKVPLVNGSIGTISNITNKLEHIPGNRTIGLKPKNIEIIKGIFTEEFNNDSFNPLNMDGGIFKTGQQSVSMEDIGKMAKWSFTKKKTPYLFDYAYCITVWKAQGSSWKNVVAIEEDHPFDREDHKKYLYTAVTRAEDRVVLVIK